MTPAEYVAANNLSQQEFGACFDPPVTQGLVSQWFRGQTRMTLAQAIQANQFSNGAISIEGCAQLYEKTSDKALSTESATNIADQQ